MADKNIFTPSMAVLDKSAAGMKDAIPAQAWGDNTPRSTDLKKQVLDAVKKLELFPKP